MRTLLPVLCMLAGALALPAETVESILSRMDQAAPQFRGVSADIQMITYTAIINDKTEETGTFKMQRKGGVFRAIIDFSGQNDAREIAFLGNIIRMYYPKLKMYQDYDVGKNADVLNQFLLLGFGSSGKELAQSYEIRSESTEKVAGADTTKLLLLPKSPAVKERLSKIEMWIPGNAAYPIQQQFYEPTNGNYRRVTYNNVKLNPSFKGNLELKLPSGVKRRGP
jgi:outer membrane lipoprotein-sorting protein